MSGALQGVRIVDMTGVGMGPMATQLLGDQGADVIKIESADGDVFRHVSPQRHAGMSHAYLNFNRNKRSVVLDMKAEAGGKQVAALLADADVFVSNMRAPALRRLGLDAQALTARFPRLIHCVCYGYSERGPYAGRAAVDDTIQAACGMAWLQGDAGRAEPEYAKTVIADKATALYVAQAITAALYSREKTGSGQAIEVPMFECMVSFLSTEHLAGRTYVPPMGDTGYGRLLNEFRRPFRTLDGFIGVVPYTGSQWMRFFELAGHPEMGKDERYSTQAARARHFPQLYEFVGQVLATRTTQEWLRLLADADIPYAAVNSLDTLVNDPHLQAMGFWQEVDHPTEGRLLQAGHPVHFSRTPSTTRRHAPGLGEHTEQVLASGWGAGNVQETR